MPLASKSLVHCALIATCSLVNATVEIESPYASSSPVLHPTAAAAFTLRAVTALEIYV